jgi:hypothetical protein
MIRFSCPACGKRLKAPDDGPGRQTNCPRCGQRLIVPSPERSRPVLGNILPDQADDAPAPPAVQWFATAPPLPPVQPPTEDSEEVLDEAIVVRDDEVPQVRRPRRHDDDDARDEERERPARRGRKSRTAWGAVVFGSLGLVILLFGILDGGWICIGVGILMVCTALIMEEIFQLRR